jgi:chemotaxis protein MotB
VENPEGNLVEDAQLEVGEIPENFDELYQYLKNYIENNNLSESIEIEKGAANVFLKFRDNIFFNPDSEILRQEGETVLDGIAPGIQAVNQYILAIRIDGHTAEAEYSQVNDRDLSTGRANAVLKYLDAMNICESEKYSATGYGKYRPEATNDTEEHRKINRRVEIIIARNDVDLTDPAVFKEFYEISLGKEIANNYISSTDNKDDEQDLSENSTDSTVNSTEDTATTSESSNTESVSENSSEQDTSNSDAT